jgi:hypothetical protein
MGDILARVQENLLGRISGPMHFRIFLQPFMATLFAVLDGRKDALEGRPPFFWGLFTSSSSRRRMLHSGWKSVGKVFIFALILDAIYQYIELSKFYPGEAVMVALLLAFVPYLMFRGVANRVFRLTGTGRKT